MSHFLISTRLICLLVSISGLSVLPAQILSVNNTNDSGPGSFRQAVLDANTTSTVVEPLVYIDFQVVQTAAAPAAAEIELLTGAPSIDRPVYILAGSNLPKPILTANGGKSILNVGNGIDGSVTIQNIRFAGARLANSGNGGAIYHEKSTAVSTSLILKLQDCEFVDNWAQWIRGYGGAIYFRDPVSDLEIRNCLFEGNRAGPLEPTLTVLMGGSAVYFEGRSLSIEDTVFRNNFCGCLAIDFGGAVWIDGGKVPAVIRRSTFEGNDGFRGVGAVITRPKSNIVKADVIFESTLFKRNKGSSAVYLNGITDLSVSSAKFDNCTFFNNIGNNDGATSGSDASALHMDEGFGSLDLSHCTIWKNQHFTSQGSAVRFPGDGSPVNISRCVIAENYSLYGSSLTMSPDISRQGAGTGTVTSGGYNFIGNGTGVESTFSAAGDTKGTWAAPLYPLLTAPNDFGGPTETCPPQPGSPLIDAIPGAFNILATDQIGTNRPQGSAADIGAVELPRVAYSTWDDQIPLAKDRGTDADPDGDGIRNLLEYYFGTNPNIANPAPVTVSRTTGGFILEIIRSTTVRPAAFTNAGLEVSETLETDDWIPYPIPSFGTTTPVQAGEIERVRTQIFLAPSIAPRRFFRAIAE